MHRFPLVHNRGIDSEVLTNCRPAAADGAVLAAVFLMAEQMTGDACAAATVYVCASWMRLQVACDRRVAMRIGTLPTMFFPSPMICALVIKLSEIKSLLICTISFAFRLFLSVGLICLLV